MEEFMKGDVVVIPFPFSDLSKSKKRPALVVASFSDEIVLCQITSGKGFDKYSVNVDDEDFSSDKLNLSSVVRCNRIFTADRKIILYKIGSLRTRKFRKISECLLDMFKV
jgi:mRNA interferase MazF